MISFNAKALQAFASVFCFAGLFLVGKKIVVSVLKLSWYPQLLYYLCTLILTEMTIANAYRSGVLANITIEEFKEAC